MINSHESIKKNSSFIKNSATFKMFSIGFLLLILLIPTSMIKSLISEREDRKNSVVREINSIWSGSQTITGPFISIPYKIFYKDKNEEIKFNIKYLNILPEELNISGEVKHKVLYRSLYEAILYNTILEFTGTFKIPQISELNIDKENILWDKAFFSIGITDLRGIQDKIKITINESIYNCSPGLKTTDIAFSGIGTLIKPMLFNTSNNFSFTINLNGSEQLSFIPIAETNNIKIHSTWPSPSFNGAFLPITRDITNHGFSATWKVLHLNRNYPQYWSGNKYKVEQSAFGLRLILTADIYQKTTRIAKYAMLFIIFTFAAFFFSEIINKRNIHPIQYILIGLAILIFYTLLLALSEYITFNYAYILSATAITILITCYSYGIINGKKFAYTILGILTLFYSYLFIVLQLEDYALIMVSIGLLIILTIVMYITRKIDWYKIESD